jgi:hypothetical protein
VRLPSLIDSFEQNTKSGDPFGVPEMVQAGGSVSISATTRKALRLASRCRSADVGGSGPKMRSWIGSFMISIQSQTRSNARHQRRRTVSSVGFESSPTTSGGCNPFKEALRRLADNAFRFQAVAPFRFHCGGNPDLKSATSGLRHQSSRCVYGDDSARR